MVKGKAAYAGEHVCDERARCLSRKSGGVECACVGQGLQPKPGLPDDGRQCAQDGKLGLLLEAESVFTTVLKPSSQGPLIRLKVLGVSCPDLSTFACVHASVYRCGYLQSSKT